MEWKRVVGEILKKDGWTWNYMTSMEPQKENNGKS